MHRRNNENIQWKPDIMTLNIISPTAIYGINKNSHTLTTSPYCLNVLLQSFKYTLTLNRHKRKWRPDIIVSTWLWNLSLDLLKPIHPSHKEQDTHRRRQHEVSHHCSPSGMTLGRMILLFSHFKADGRFNNETFRTLHIISEDLMWKEVLEQLVMMLKSTKHNLTHNNNQLKAIVRHSMCSTYFLFVYKLLLHLNGRTIKKMWWYICWQAHC